MLNIILIFLFGNLFGLGLGVSGMMNPDKVIGFLDVAGGAWDPTLLLVMGGALTIGIFSFYGTLKKKKPIRDEGFCLSKNKNLDRNIIFGSILFGIGWGLVGICPGPSLANLTVFNFQVYVFFFSMLLGIAIEKFVLRRK